MRLPAKLLSYLAHPILGPTYLLVLLLLVNPYLFGVTSIWDKGPLLALVISSSVFVPVLVILMMVGLEIIPDMQMEEREQRTIPLIAVGMLFLGVFAFCRNDPTVPAAYTALVLGCVSGLFGAFFFNLFTKISLHAVGMGGILAATLVILELFSYSEFLVPLPLPWSGQELEFSMLGVLFAVILLTGAVGTARLILKAHVLEEVVGGYLVGFMAMALSVYFYF